MLNLNKVFHGSTKDRAFSDRIEPSAEQRALLTASKNNIRDHLRPLIRAATVKVLGMEHAVDPRFRVQGSWSYKTCVQPPVCPPQEMDWDLGIYLPIHVWEDNGPPHAMAKAYFALVEGLLQSFCRDKSWRLVSGKNTCIRVQVATWAHIDIPLYAAPEKKFQQVMEKAALTARASTGAHDSAHLLDGAEFLEMQGQVWADLDDIVLATRSGEWKASDPEAVARWFRDRVHEHTEQLRRVCRYLKAWRDYHWHTGGPTSISIMVAVAQAFEVRPGRDDIALEKAARHLSDAFLGAIREPAIGDGDEDFSKRLTAEERMIASKKAAELAKALQQARSLMLPQKEQALRALRACMGDRISDDGALVELDNGVSQIRAQPAQHVVAPVVRATSAG